MPAATPRHPLRAATLVLALALAVAPSGGGTAPAEAQADAAVSAATMQAGLQAARWGSNVTVTFADGYMRYRSNGIPNHARQAEYALPLAGGRGGPTAATSYAAAVPRARNRTTTGSRSCRGRPRARRPRTSARSA